MKYLFIALTTIAVNTQFLNAQVTDQDIFDHNLIFHDDVQHKDYPQALIQLNWLLENDPDLKKNVYIKGAKVIDENIKLPANQQIKEELQVLAIDLYNQRIEKFGSSSKVTNLRLTKMYQYWASNKGRYQEVLDSFNDVLNSTPDVLSNINLLAYMDMLRRAKKVGMEISDERIIAAYDQISTLIESRNEISEDSDIYMDKINGIFTKIVKLTCQELEERYADSIIDDIAAIGSSKLYVKLGIASGCQNDDVFHAALDNVIKYDPSLNLLLYKAKLLLAQEKLDEAENHFGKALSFELNPETQSDVYLSLAKIYTIRNQKNSARNYAVKAIKANDNKEAHSIIGNLYMSSFSECADGKDIVERRAVFIAAYNQFKLANDTQNMAIAKASFPSSGEIHMNNYEVGQEIEVNCWFKETVSLDRRSN